MLYQNSNSSTETKLRYYQLLKALKPTSCTCLQPNYIKLSDRQFKKFCQNKEENSTFTEPLSAHAQEKYLGRKVDHLRSAHAPTVILRTVFENIDICRYRCIVGIVLSTINDVFLSYGNCFCAQLVCNL